MTNRKSILGACLLGVVTLCASPAFAHTVTTTGAQSSNGPDGLSISDTLGDGNFVYANWNGTTANRLENHNGVGTTVLKQVGAVNAHRACRNNSAGSDNCSAFSVG